MSEQPVGITEKSSASQPQFHDPQKLPSVAPVLEEIRNQTNGTPESIKEYFGTLSFEAFSEILNKLNGYYRNIPAPNNMDGTGLMADGYIPPDHEDRSPLLKEAFEKAIQEDSPEKCGTVLGISILTIHPYLDGNGRTSRTIFALLTNGYTGSDGDKALFAEIGEKDDGEEEHQSGWHIIDLDPSNIMINDHTLADWIEGDMKWSALSKRFGTDLVNYPVRVGTLGGLSFRYNPNLQLSEEEQIELNNMSRSNSLAFIACVNSFSDELYEKSLKHVNFEGKEYNIISIKNAIGDMTKDDLSKLRKAFRQARIDYVREVMDVTKRSDFQDIYKKYSAKLEAWRKEKSSS